MGVLTGTPRVFSAGSDISIGRGASAATERGGEYGVIRRQRVKPLIAAVEGPALGGGFEIVLACDLVVASRTASFGLPEVKRGLVPTCGGLFRTPRALPLNVAKEMLLTGESLTPERAYSLGLVNVVAEPGEAVTARDRLGRADVPGRAGRRTRQSPRAGAQHRRTRRTGVGRHARGDRARSRAAMTYTKEWPPSSRSASRIGRDGSAMGTDVILVDVTDRVAVVTLNRPEARNALSPELNAAIAATITECDARDDVDAIVLTGADPAFCAGVDLKSLGNDSDVKHIVAGQDDLIRPFPETVKPVIGAINGAAVTGGLEVALTCDFLIASEHARFADTHARVGIMPGWGLTVLLAEAIGQRRAREMSVTGNFVDARTALEWGLVNHVVAHDELLPFCRALGADIVTNDQGGVRNVLATYHEQERVTDHDVRHIELRRSRVARRHCGRRQRGGSTTRRDHGTRPHAAGLNR